MRKEGKDRGHEERRERKEKNGGEGKSKREKESKLLNSNVLVNFSPFL
jgi:hypothetical protein